MRSLSTIIRDRMTCTLVVAVVSVVLQGVTRGQTPQPLGLPTNGPSLSSLLIDSSGRRINSKEGWSAERAKLKERWQRYLGDFPKSKAALNAQVGPTEKCDGFDRQYVKYQIADGVFTDGYLMTPAHQKGRAPAVVVFHPTTPFQARGVAGLEKDYPEEKWQGVQLAKRGYVVWCPRNYIYEQGTNWEQNARRVLASHTNWTGMTRMVWDAIRAADFVASLPNVDSERIGCLGHSLGGKEVLFAMAFDERYKAGVSSEGGIGLKSSNWDALWYLGPGIKAPGFDRENHEVLALVAPRAFLLIGGDSADTARSFDYIEAAKPIYVLLGAPGNLVWLDHHLGHRYPPEARVAAEAFLDEHLKAR